MYIPFRPESQRRQLHTRRTPVPQPLIAYHHMADNLPYKRSHQTTLRKHSRRKRDARVDAGELDPSLISSVRTATEYTAFITDISNMAIKLF